jgi:CRP-like cAMP-binding protein
MTASGTDESAGDELCRHLLAESSVARRQLRKGGTFQLDTVGEGFAVVVDGALALQTARHDGSSITLEILGRGACVPTVALTGARRRGLVLTALVPSSVARLQMSSFERVLRQKPFLSTLVGANMATQHAELLERIAVMSERSPSCRLASTILYIARRIGQRCCLAEGTRVPLPQHVIGGVADLSRQTANRTLRQLQSMGLVRIERGMVCLLDAAALKAVADGAPLAPVWKPPGPCRFLHPEAPLTCYQLRRASSGKSRQN